MRAFLLKKLLLFSPGTKDLLDSLKSHKDSEVRILAQALPHFLMQDLTPNTIKKYMASFQKWSAWAKSKSCSPIPAPVELFAAFLVLQIKSCNSSSAFDTVIASIAWAHRKRMVRGGSEAHLSEQLINAGHRLLGKNTTNRKKPLLHTHVKALIDKFGRGSLAELQILVLISLGFFGLFSGGMSYKI